MNFAFQEQTAAVEDLQIPLDNHSDLFGPHMDEESALPSVEIRLKDPDEIVWVPPRRLSQREEEIVNEEVEELLQMDTITRSTSTFDTPIVVVEHKGKNRVCFDFRELNKHVENCRYPLPRIWGLLEKLGGGYQPWIWREVIVIFL